MAGGKKPDPYGMDQASGAAPAAGGEPAAASSLFDATVVDGVHVVTFSRSDVLDAHYIKRLGDDLYHHLKPVEAPRVVVDLGNVEFLSSAALGMLIALRKVVEGKQKGKMCIANISGDLFEVFKLMKLHKLMKIHDSREKAVASLR
jgi:anti-sigma B factor antagonist